KLQKCTKYMRTLHNMIRKTWDLDHKKKKTLYKAFLRPALIYGAEIWLPYIKVKTLNKLEQFQHQALRNTLPGYTTISRACTHTLTNMPTITTHLNTLYDTFQLNSNNSKELKEPELHT